VLIATSNRPFRDVVPINANAAVILSVNLLRRVDCTNAEQDMKSIHAVLQHFKALEDNQTDTYLRHLRVVLQELYSLAQTACCTSENNVSHELQSYNAPDLIPTGHQNLRRMSHRRAGSDLQPTSSPFVGSFTIDQNAATGDVFEFGSGSQLPLDDDSLQRWTHFGQIPFDVFSYPWSLDMVSGGPPEGSMGG
jgi:hypothetical protein